MDDPKRFAFIFAVDEGGGFGRAGGLPWPKVRADMAQFRRLTMGHFLCVGRETARTLPPLPGRTVITLTREVTEQEREENLHWNKRPDLRQVYTADDMLGVIAQVDPTRRVLFGGGAQALWGLNGDKRIQYAYVSVIHGEHEAGTRLSLHRWIREGCWFRVSKVEDEGVTFYEYARGTTR